MTKIYRTTDNNYVTLVAHDHDLQDEMFEHYGAFEYSIRMDESTGQWILSIFDLASEELLDVDSLSGINGKAVAVLVNAARGLGEYEDIMGSDYYERCDLFVKILEDDVLFTAVAAEYAEKVMG